MEQNPPKLQKVALPPLFRQELQAFRFGEDKNLKYLVRAKWKNETHEFEPWQFFIFEVLPGCDEFPKLASVFEDRFGNPISENEVQKLIASAVDRELLDPSSFAHTLVAPFKKEGPIPFTGDFVMGASFKAEAGEEKPKSESGPDGSKAPKENFESTRAASKKEELPPGIHEAVGLDHTMGKQGFKLFNPGWFIRLIHPLLFPLRHLIYVLPLMLIAALLTGNRHYFLLEEDIRLLFGNISFIEHALVSMLTVNLAATLITALVAHTYRATVSGLCIVFYMVFFPRFTARIGHVDQLSRRERIWLHAAPLLLRLGFFAFGVLAWYHTRGSDPRLSMLALLTAIAGIVSFFITANPFVKSNGYHLLSAVLNEPHLRGKSYKVLLNKFRGNVYKKSDSNVLAAYALSSALFTLALAAPLLYLFGRFLRIYLGGAGVLLIFTIVVILLWKLTSKLMDVQRAYERSLQYERWRKITLSEIENEIDQKERSNSFLSYLRRSMLLLFLPILFLPYTYEPGGYFTVLPSRQQNISSEIDGIIETLHFDGGEFIPKDTVIGQLSHSEYLAQVKIYAAKIKEQEAITKELMSRPRPEELQVARSALKTQKTRADFSRAKAVRLEKLYKAGTIPFEEWEDARKEADVDADQVIEKTANLELVKAGSTPDEIEAAKAKLQSYREERDFYQQRIEQSIFRMPFDGKLVTMHLKQKIGSFLEKGKVLAVAENTNMIIVEIEVPEPDIAYIRKGAAVRFRPFVYSDEDFHGVVTFIDGKVTKDRFGKVVKVTTLMENPDGRIKTGMTGYGKIDCGDLPVWKTFTLAVTRFFNVEAWSWIP